MPLPLLDKRVCACGCGRIYQPTRVDQKYATNSCNVRAYRHRRLQRERVVGRKWWVDLEVWQQELVASMVGENLSHADDFYVIYREHGLQYAWDAVLFAARFAMGLDSQRAVAMADVLEREMAAQKHA